MRNLLFIIIILISSCTENNRSKFAIEVNHEFNLSQEASYHLHRMYTTVAYSETTKEFLFTNYASPVNVIITDRTGNLVELLNKEGRGPDEIQSARYLAFSDSNITILDKMSAVFKVYKREQQTSINYDYPINEGISVTSRNMQFCEDNWYLGVQLLGKNPVSSVPVVGVFSSSFELNNLIGKYDPFFDGRQDLMQEPVSHIDCKENKIYTTHSKLPFIQSFFISNTDSIERTTIIPKNFMLSDRFIQVVNSRSEMQRYLSEEQSLTLFLGTSNQFLFHAFKNDKNIDFDKRGLNDSDYYLAIYDKSTLNYLGQLKMPGAVLGFSEMGQIIILKNELDNTFQLLDIRLI